MSNRKKCKTHILIDHNKKEFAVADKIIDKAVDYLKRYQLKPEAARLKGSCSLGTTVKSLGIRRRNLHTRQLPEISHGLRGAILRRRWNEAAYYAHILSLTGISLYSSLIIRTCFLLLFNHPNSTPQLLEEFVRKCTDYTDEKDIRKFIKIIFAIRSEPLAKPEVGKYIRKGIAYKLVDEMIYKDL